MHVIIKTSQRKFVTDPDGWIGQSLYFNNLFSGKWGDKQKDNSYFIETDADLFEHILCYLRTGVLPVFYDRVAGHDFPLYQALLGESKYFAIDRLEKWLCERQYLEAVEIQYTARKDCCVDITTGSNVETTILPMTVQRNKFYCPSAIHGESSEERCRGCAVMAKNEGLSGVGGWKKVDEVIWCITQKEVVFDHNLCVNAFRE